MADTKERIFQTDILNSLEAQGWLVGKAANYDRLNALYTEDLLHFVREAYPERWEKFAKSNSANPEKILIQALTRALERDGALHVLRHGFKVIGGHINICAFKPDHGMNPDTERRYGLNQLRVVEEVSYSPHAREGANSAESYNPRIDLVLFVNGIPTATLELKSEFKQTIEHAKAQYKKDRPLKDPLTRKPEPLLAFKRGALVHFAVTQDEVAMTTKLAGNDTFFLPFNMGSDEGGAGNPAPKTGDYATSYLWTQLFAKDNWLNILARFMHLQVDERPQFDGSISRKETLIFPRFHQWDVVNQLIHTTRSEGPGKRYLIQHSAGSGKSNSIAWTAHQLASLYQQDEKGQHKKLFSSVIVVTDRTVLDSQLQNTIRQFEHADGMIKAITRDIGNLSKSEQLAEALQSNTRIIIVTIQTFPALYDALDRYPKLAEGHYAIIADEAHSSQTGSSAAKLKAILGSDKPDGEELSAEELLSAAVQARTPTDRISYYAFTATPKGKTLELFGRPEHPDEPLSDSNKPFAFHLYSMRQAIEEGFILDVLNNYTTYATAWKIAHPDGEDTEVESKQARIKLAKWVRLHPYNISQRVEIIVEHFRTNVRHLLNGQAKAMVVTAGREDAVRYQLAMQQYIKDKGYVDVHALVAFSGSILPNEVIPEEVTETSQLLNPGLKGRDHAKALDSDDFNVLIVANKYQTGFDQPKLCAMYVDKKLAGVECVQTLSRLNRTFPGKNQTFILDFVNAAEDVKNSFAPYYTRSEIETVTDPYLIFDIQKKLDDEHIYQWSEVRGFAQTFYDPKASASKLSFFAKPAKERFTLRYRQAKEAYQLARDAKAKAQADGNTYGIKAAEEGIKQAGETVDQLDLFKKNLTSFIRLYEFMSQIVPYEDNDLEALCVYGKNLLPLLRADRLEDPDDFDLTGTELTHYRITKKQELAIRLGEEDGPYLKGITEVGSGKAHDPEKKKLSEIIDALNDLFGAEVSDDDKLHFARGVAERITKDEPTMAQISKHTPDEVMYGRFPQLVTDTILDMMTDNEKLATEVLASQQKGKDFARLILRLLAN
ncbi:Type I site-specific restriction-modification system, R subunit (helicase) [Alishewanella agri BL06]|uniref:Type I site-specific restriction-modification system, R subunit (Helicase) n=1 Tax=Alishewanella agri BL06 TaxID=1195246 RepID=I9DSJ4_9ALTE|nr:DEAD/DEAH box helicase family protein [Alishewanella agri]EIW89055.1 Type I site-specific restriction-modification system, R subunit (helicase) [Alishewanella agri BL06]